MPHDKNGVEVKCGDVVRVPADGYPAHEVIGSVMSVIKGAESCNLNVEAVAKNPQTEYSESLPALSRFTVTAAKCEKLA